MAKNKFNTPKIPNSNIQPSASQKRVSPRVASPSRTTSSDKSSLNFIYVALVWLYSWFIVIPHFDAWDTNATHFMLLGFLNLIVYVYMFSTDTFKDNRFFRWVFFKNPAGIAYCAYIFFMFLSLTKIVNFGEAIITCSKYFTTFTSTLILTMMISADKRYLNHLAQAMCLVLLWDVVTLIKYLLKYIDGGPGIYDFKSNYSNKNIYSAAILVKVPFAVWLYLRDNTIWSKIGLFMSFGAFFSIWVLSTRTSYLGILLLFIVLAAYMLFEQLRSYRTSWVHYWKVVIPMLIAIGGSLLVYNGIRLTLYPSQEGYGSGVAARLSTIGVSSSNTEDHSIKLRFTSWKDSYKLFKDDPILGAGIGNWKIKALKYENRHNGSFTYMYKAHNDFVETFAELGILGGGAYLGIFFMVVMNFFRKYRPESDEENAELQFDNSALFLGLFGLTAYSIDAFFNFPADRPPMQIILASFIAVSVSYSMYDFRKLIEDSKVQLAKYYEYGHYLTYMVIAISVMSAYVLWVNYQSSKVQWIIAQDSAQPKQKLTGDELVRKIPKIPDITVVEEPMAVVKGRYYINENRFRDGLKQLLPDNSSPWDGRTAYLTGFCYLKLNQLDSAIYYAKEAVKVKPLFWGASALMCDVYMMQGNLKSAMEITESFLDKVRNNTAKWQNEPSSEKAAWQMSAAIYERQGNRKGAIAMIDSAIARLGDPDTSLTRTKMSLMSGRGTNLSNNSNNNSVPNPNFVSFQQAANAYNSKNYALAVQAFTKFLTTERNPANILKAREFRGYSYFYVQKYANALADFNYVRNIVKDNMNVNAMYQMCMGNLGKSKQNNGIDLSKLNTANGQQQLTPQMMEALQKAQAEERKKEFEKQQQEIESRKNILSPEKIEQLKKAQQEAVKP